MTALGSRECVVRSALGWASLLGLLNGAFRLHGRFGEPDRARTCCAHVVMVACIFEWCRWLDRRCLLVGRRKGWWKSLPGRVRGRRWAADRRWCWKYCLTFRGLSVRETRLSAVCSFLYCGHAHGEWLVGDEVESGKEKVP